MAIILGMMSVLIAQAQYGLDQRLTASDATNSDSFGRSVSISGNRIAIGAVGDDDNGENSGSAYIFERQGDGNWQEVQKLLTSDGATLDAFGSFAALSGDRLVVGATGDDDNGESSGSVYIFERQGDGNWQEVQKLTASDGTQGDSFGRVSLSGDRLAIGATGDDDNGESSGSVYIFERQGDGSWQEVAKLIASDGAPLDRFGGIMSLSGERLIVGVGDHDDDNGFNTGAVYVFERQDDGSWQEVQQLTASDAAEGDNFGGSVSQSGDRLIVGASGDDDNEVSSGSVYVFERQGDGSWQEVQKLTASDAGFRNFFGSRVALQDDRLVVTAPNIFIFNGAVYVFERQADGSWQEVIKLTGSNTFGSSLSLSGERFVVGDRGEPGSPFDLGGSASVFRVTSSAPDFPCDCARATVRGTNGNDKLVGTAGDDIICGFGGDDRLFGEGGNDCMDGGTGNDRLFGGGGNDLLLGRSGNDQLRGEAGNDVLNGSAGDDFLQGGGDDDVLRGDGGNDRLRGDAGMDDLRGGSGDDNLRGGSGADTLRGDSGNDMLRGDDGDDVLRGGAGEDVVDGDSGDDNASGGSGNDIVKGDGGNDILAGNGGDDLIRGGAGDDDLSGGAGDDDLSGGRDNDRLRGDGGNDILRGNNGDDDLNGGSGDDVLQGGLGSDRCQGGSGTDTASTCDATVGVP